MSVVLLTVAVSVLFGYMFGGRLRNLAHVQLRRPWLALVAVGLQVLVGLVASANLWDAVTVPVLLAASHVCLLAFVWCNRALPGSLLILFGIGANALVITANAGMPVARAALLEAIGPGSVDPGKHRLLEAGDRFAVLADVLPVPPLRSVVSIGDLILAAGVGVLTVALMRTPPAPAHPDERSGTGGDAAGETSVRPP